MKYNIYDILKVDSDIKLFPESLAGEFEKADVTVKRKDLEIDKSKHKQFSLKFWGKEKSLYFESRFYIYPLNKILVKDFKEFYYLRNSNYYNTAIIALIMLEISLLEKGYTFLHAGAVKKDGKGYLVTALPEGGKSTTTLSLGLDDGEILGDDTVLLSQDGTVYSLSKKLRVYSGSKIIDKLNLPLKKKLEVKLRHIISKISPLHRVVDANLTLDSEYFKTTDQAKINEIIVLPENEKQGKEFLVNSLLNNTLSLFSSDFPNRIFQIYCFMNGIDPTFFTKRMKEVITRAVDSIK